MADLAPVVLFIYNRPDHTARTLASLAANPLAAETDLIIHADGSKKPEHAHSVEEARAVARQARGFKSVRMIERERNLGLAQSVIAGVSEACADRGRVIVLEDDLLVAPQFLTFLNRGLQRFADEESVFQVSGYMFPVSIDQTCDGFFLPLINCWGWATWQRAWSQFDRSAAGYILLERDLKLRKRFNLDDHYDYFGMLRDQVTGKIDSWGVLWLLTVFLQDGLVFYPRKSLVHNVGVDGTGTHGRGAANLQRALQIETESPGWENRWPTNIDVDVAVLDRVKALLSSSSRPDPVRRFIRRLMQ
jgi:cbb3-type cytochrome oxidase subunit 3